jgi:hypothetical protein
MPGTVHVLRQIDVGDSIRLEHAARVLADRELTRGTTVLRSPEEPSTSGVFLRHEPLDLKLGRVQAGPFAADVRARLFEFGVVAFRFTFALEDGSAPALIQLSHRLMRESNVFDAKALELWRDLGRSIQSAVVPWEEGYVTELQEDFTVFVLPAVVESELGADRVFAHVLHGEPATRKLAPSLVTEVSRRAIRYHEDDLVLVDYDAAIVVERDEAKDLVDIFEIASAQLLELRFYDAMLGRSLEGMLRDVRRARTAAWFFRSPFRRLARRAAVLALELGELSDRLERAITLVGDTYSAQIYRETALRFRLSESSASVREKVGMLGRISEVLGHEIHSRRDLVLEILIIVLITIEAVLALAPRTGR